MKANSYLSLISIILGVLSHFCCIAQQKNDCHNFEKKRYKKDDQKLRIPTRIGPEDFVLDTITNEGPRLILGSANYRDDKHGLGAILHYAIYDGSATIDTFKLIGYESSKIRPHGLAITSINNIPYLYVISHEVKEGVKRNKPKNDEKWHKILQFEIRKNTLVFQKSYSNQDEAYRLITNPNDLFVTSDGGIYCTNPSELSLFNLLFKRKKGYVNYIAPDGKIRQLISRLVYPNGILATASTLYVADTRKNQLLTWELAKQGSINGNPPQVKARLKGGDNISLMGDNLYIAHHPKQFRFMLYAMYGWKSPSSVVEYNTRSGFCKRIFKSNGRLISGSSTAIPYNDTLYITQVMGGFIVAIPKSLWVDCKCK